MTNPKAGHRFFLKRIVVGPLEANCYVVADPLKKDACLIDPGAEGQAISDIVRKRELDLKFIINTHGHGDHIAANGYFNIPIYIHKLDADFLTDPAKNLSRMFIFGVKSPKASRLLEDKEEIGLGGLRLKIIHTPGHTPGSISIQIENAVFSGDALFAGGIGRTDFPYGDEALLLKSIRERLFVLGDDTIVYPGHGESTTIRREKRTNLFLL